MAVYDGSFGAGTGIANTENVMVLVLLSGIGANETPQQIEVYLDDSTGANTHTTKGVMFDSAGNFIAETSARSDITTGGVAPFTLTFSTNPSLSAGNYYVGMYSNSGGGNLNVGKNDGVGTRYVITGSTYPTVPATNTVTNSGDSATLRLRLTTNDPASGQANVFTGKFGRPLTGKL